MVHRTFQISLARAIRSPFRLPTSGIDQITIGTLIDNRNILLENIEHSTIPVHRDQARPLNIHPNPHYKVQAIG
jgi:hypothetical protein